MAVTQNTYTGNGSTVLYSFTFPYLDESDIKVEVNGSLTTAYTLANATTIQFNTAPANGALIRIYRVTDDVQLKAEFFPGSAVRAQDLNENFNQSLYIAQETSNKAVDKSNPQILGNLDFNNFKGINLATPTANADAANKSYVDSVIATGAANAAAAAASANAAAASATSAANSYDAFDDRYLGAKATDPSVDNDGNTLLVGAIYFNSTSKVMRVWNGTSWQDASANANVLRWRKTAVGGETSLSGADDNAATLTYTVNLEFVYLNGALLQRGIDYTASNGTSITGLTALTAGDVVEVVSYTSFSLVNVPGSTIQDGTISTQKLADGAVTSDKIADGTIVNADVNANAGIAASKLSFTQSGTGAVARTIDSRLKDWLSVKDFGATGNGSTDDTAAVQAAFTAAQAQNRAVFFPAGTYKITSTVDAKTRCFFGEDRNSSKILCAVANGTRTFSDAGSVVRDLYFGGPGGGATPDALGMNSGYKFYVVRCWFQNLGDCIVVKDIIVTSVINQCEFLACVTAVSDKLHDASSAHTTLYFTDNNVLYGTNGFYMKTEAQGFLIEGNVFEDMAVVYHGSGTQIYQFKFSTNWIEQVYKNCTIFSSVFQGATNVAINNSLRPGPMSITDSTKLLASQFSLVGDANGGGGGVRIQEDAIRLCNFQGNGIRITDDGIRPSAATANFTNPPTLTFATQSANANQTAAGGDWILAPGSGSNGQRSGLLWGLPADGSAMRILGRSNLASNGTDYGLTLGSTSYYWGSTSDINFLNSYISIGGAFSTGGNGLTTGVVDIYSGGAYNGNSQTASPVITCRFGALNVFPGTDNQTSLGISGNRWSVVYAATGTINTSDANEKQQVEELSDAERSVAVAIKGLIRKFKFNDAVEAKGDQARIHIGVIAQDVEQAFIDAGLDPSHYGLFCRDEWWELDGQMVAADEDGTVNSVRYELNGEPVAPDENGNLPEGAERVEETKQATKRTRLGIRYEELFAFVLAAL